MNLPLSGCRTLFVLCVSLLPAAVAYAQSTPVGLWRSIDESNVAKALVRVVENEGVLSGRIEKLLNPDQPNPLCEKCSDERKGAPVIGMLIIRGVKKNADDATQWDGGDILDPDNGSVYKVRIKPMDNGTKLEVRGYFGAPLFGRTQIWHRVE